MAKIILHIGFGKTGSSSLQTYLSETAARRIGNSRFRYCAIGRDGRIIFGRELVERANSSMVGSVSSYEDIADLRDFRKTRESINRICADGTVPIFSQEDWGRGGAKFQESNFLEEINCDAEVVAYVRPQIEWFNSAWWQWFNWEEQFSCPDDVISMWGCGMMKWADQLENWRKVKGVNKITARLHCTDTVKDFLGVFGLGHALARGEPIYKNAGLSSLVLKLYEAIPALRTTHGSDTDAFFTQLLDAKGRSPWIVSRELADTITAETRADNLMLLTFLDEAQQVAMKADQRWWTSAAYETHPRMVAGELNLSRDECIQVLSTIVPELLNLERERRAKGKRY